MMFQGTGVNSTILRWLQMMNGSQPQSLNQWVNSQVPNAGRMAYTYNNSPVYPFNGSITRSSFLGSDNVEPRGPYQGLPRPFDTAFLAHQPLWGVNQNNSGAPTNASPNSGDMIRSNTGYPHVPLGRAMDILQMLPYLFSQGNPTIPKKIAGGGNGPL